MKYLSFLLAVLLALGIFAFPSQAQESSSQNFSLYLTMRDGVRIAVDVWLPQNADEKVPTLMNATRYWRAYHNLPETDPVVGFFNAQGYAAVKVDVRGTGASEGVQTMVWSSDEIADLGEVAAWIASQEWSNGNIGTYGVSYEGNTAELAAVPNQSAIKAVAPMYSDFDPLRNLAMPGGVFNDWFIAQWEMSNQLLDTNDMCALAEQMEAGNACEDVLAVTQGIKNVDEDANREQVNAIIAARTDNINVYEMLSAMDYADESGGAAESLAVVSPYGQRDAIESSGVNMYVWSSWLDAATTDGTLSRFMTFSNPQKVIIGAWSHGGEFDADPFQPADAAPQPSIEAQYTSLVEFFDAQLKGETPAPVESEITYYTMNAGTWTTTSVWPPEGFENQTWYFGADQSLTLDAPTSETGADEYTVDFTATTGPTSRWHTQLGGGDVIYPDRAAEDEKLLTYTSAPLENAVEITGNPVVTLHVASSEADTAFHVYLEAVAPDGSVTYITEGILRADNRAVSDDAPYAVTGVYHSLNRADAVPLVVGETTEIQLNLYATSVWVDAGYSLRIAIAGADAGLFARYPTEGTPVWTVERNSVFPSHMELPVKQ